MAILRIKPTMIESLPGDKIPELVEAREGKNTLYDRLKNLDATTIRGYIPISKDGDSVNGELVLNGGAIIPEDASLIINGDVQFNGTISRVGSAETTGTYGLSVVVANVCEAALDVIQTQIVADFKPKIDGNFLIYIYFRISSVTTGLTLKINYRDGGGLTQQTIINNQYYDVGSYSLPPIFINALSVTPIVISANTQIPDQIYVSASIIGL